MKIDPSVAFWHTATDTACGKGAYYGWVQGNSATAVPGTTTTLIPGGAPSKNVITYGTDTLTLTFQGTASIGAPSFIAPPLSRPAPRRPAPLEFSPYINASELVIEFMGEAQRLLPGLTRERFLKLTVADFFAFLIRRAAAADGVPPPELEQSPLPTPGRRLHCGACGRFLPRRFELLQLAHCSVPCFDRALAQGAG